MNIKPIQEYVLQLITTHARPTILLGLSGGADSVFLFHTLLALHKAEKITLIALHINHGWRETALRDEQFCTALGAMHDIQIIIEKVAHGNSLVPSHKRNSGSKEADAREARRVIFEEYRQKHGAAYIALAHHADDQIETFFIRLIRGAGLTGLCSMRPTQDHLLRPLLSITKAEILAWLAENNQTFCHDETNESMAFLRNRIRTNFMPLLAECDSRALRSTLRTITHLQQEEEVLLQLCTQTLEALKDPSGWYKIESFLACAPALRTRILTSLLIQASAPFTPTEGLFKEIERFLNSRRSGTHTIRTGLSIKKKKRFFCIATQNS